MTRTISLVAALLLASGTATVANAKTFSIQITGFCDHLTVTVTNGVLIGASDTSSCDTSIVVGNRKGKALNAAGDLGYGPTESWTWNFATLPSQAGTATLTGTDGTTTFGPLAFSYTSSKSGNRNLPPAVSAFKHK